MSFSCQKREFDRFSNRLDRPVEESRPDRQPDRFPSLASLINGMPWKVAALKQAKGGQNKF